MIHSQTAATQRLVVAAVVEDVEPRDEKDATHPAVGAVDGIAYSLVEVFGACTEHVGVVLVDRVAPVAAHSPHVDDGVIRRGYPATTSTPWLVKWRSATTRK